MNTKQLKQKYFKFFEQKKHALIKSSSLIPENDPSVLFTTAGMHPLVPFLMGEPHPLGKRLVNVQKCIRTGDIDVVGDPSHLTFFEMLGNWSLGDYFKDDMIRWSYEFLTDKKWLGLDKNRLAVTCFKGDKDAPKDDEASKVWLNLGIPDDRIAFLPKEDNWWGPAGETGPCGPDTEMFYWSANDVQPPKKFDPKDKRWFEIWNDVFLQYNKTKDGKYLPLKQKNVDTGMGVERTSAMLQGKSSVYEIESFKAIIKKIMDLSNITDPDESKTKSIRIIADHLRSSTFILGDDLGIKPSNLDQGYIIRRLIRRAIRHGKLLNINDNFCSKIASVIIDIYQDEYPELSRNKKFILEELDNEEQKFEKTLRSGLKVFESITLHHKEVIPGKDAFMLFASYGFPLEMSIELAKEKNIKVDQKGFEEEFAKHQELSRKSTEGKFKGGLGEHSDETIRLHTATHLLHAALRKVLGSNVSQKGSNITNERLRFDFTYEKKMTPEELKEVEDIVNKQIIRALDVSREEMSLDEARKKGALAFFQEKYGEKVSVYTVGDFSKEVCGGPHVKNTKELGHFQIKKEEAIAAGVRRIKAVLE